MTHKGSKKHVLELIDSNDFIATMNKILLPYYAEIVDNKHLQPKGSKNVSECGIQTFITKNKLKERFPTLTDFDFNKWWSPHSGIKRMFLKQKERFFPLPDFDLSDQKKVVVKIAGRIWDENYTKLLMSKTDLDLKLVVLLDRVQKSLPITEEEMRELKKLGLIEGNKRNFFISSKIAEITGGKAEYIKQRGIDDEYCKKIILDYLGKFEEGKREDFEKILLDKLPDVLDISQKQNKIKNNLQSLKKQGLIEPRGKVWTMSKLDI